MAPIMALSPSSLGGPQSSFYSAREAELKAREALLGAQSAEAKRRAQSATDIEAARVSPENVTIAQN